MPILDHDQMRNMRAVLTLVVPALFSLVTVKFQGSSDSPLETHALTMFFSIFALLLYCSLSLRLAAHPPPFATACGACFFRVLVILSFSLSIALPTLLLFPGPSFLLLHLPVLMLLSADRLYGLVQELIGLVKRRILAFVFRLLRRRLLRGRAPPILPRSWIHCGNHLTTSIVAPALLSLPYAFALLGWAGGIVCLVVAALVTFYSYNLISLVLEHHAQMGHRHLRFRDMAHDVIMC